ncbi:acetylcholine receptor subunit alpha-1-B-like [Saccostrea echinata]|uniref:acetylcholine receptor subunit alpha-1-B-like n=1 Tax=Saccostrea echinata TaxID=191078 RepID=UPI002A815064|nr:acetylcholine receptor subunit alpha-1-B-like [Saccostrea echinata]
MVTLSSAAWTNSDVTTLLASNTFTNYDKRIRPRATQSDVVDVYIKFGLTAITGLDEIGGTLYLVGYLDVTWRDDLIAWNTGSVDQLMMSHKDIWTPAVTLYTSVSSLSELGASDDPVTILKDGTVNWRPGLVIESGCAIDVSYYPFDTQECTVTFLPWQYTSDLVHLMPNATMVDISLLQKSSEWDLTETTVKNTSGVFTEVSFKLTLKRRPQYFILNMVLPIILIGLLNGFVFVMPFDQGRVGFIITGFLSIGVFLTVIADVLPKSSNPMSLLAYFIIWQLMLGALCTLESILTLKIYHRHGKMPLPNSLKKFLSVLWCYPCRGKSVQDEKPPKGYTFYRKRYQLHSVSVFVKEFKMKRKGDDNDNPEFKEKPEPKVSWKTLGSTLDIFFFFVFIILNIAIYMMFLVPLANAA